MNAFYAVEAVQVLMHLLLKMTKASQELGIGELDPNYKNPFHQTMQGPASEKPVISSEEDQKEKKKKKKPKLERGPRMSSGRTEL